MLGVASWLFRKYIGTRSSSTQERRMCRDRGTNALELASRRKEVEGREWLLRLFFLQADSRCRLEREKLWTVSPNKTFVSGRAVIA